MAGKPLSPRGVPRFLQFYVATFDNPPLLEYNLLSCVRHSRAHSFFVQAVIFTQETCKMYAVIESGSKQYRVAEGDVIEVESLPIEAGKEVELERVLMITNPEGIKVGTPIIEGAKVTATVQSHGRGRKIIVYKHKKNYHKKQGHRQNFTRLHIDKITG
jgi:large subunit ribosomal protein L21